MKFLKQKDGFLGYDANTQIQSKVVVVPFGLEKTVSYGGGTKNAPKEIIKASHQVELFDEELNKETFRSIGIKTLKPFEKHPTQGASSIPAAGMVVWLSSAIPA